MEMHSRFEIIRTLGHGGMATVYLAYDGQDGRNVALKVLASNLAGDDVYRARFLREARLAARVRHPNVVRVYGVGEDARGPFIAMEVVEGPTLADEITRRGRFSPGDAAQVAAELASALAELHASQLVHRDVTPRNVLLDREGRPKLADFGIARLLDGTRLTEHGTIMGTAAYVCAGAGARRGRDPVCRRVFARRGALRASHRAAAVRGGHTSGAPSPAGERRRRSAAQAGARRLARPRANGLGGRSSASRRTGRPRPHSGVPRHAAR